MSLALDTIYHDMLRAARLPADNAVAVALANAYWGNETGRPMDMDSLLIELAARAYECGRMEGRREVFAAVTPPAVAAGSHRGSRR